MRDLRPPVPGRGATGAGGGPRGKPSPSGPCCGSGRLSGLGPSTSLQERWAASSVPLLQMEKPKALQGNELTQDPVEEDSPVLFPCRPTFISFWHKNVSYFPSVFTVCQARWSALGTGMNQTRPSPARGAKWRDELRLTGARRGSKSRLPWERSTGRTQASGKG